MTDPNKTHITAIIDCSGSMSRLTTDTIGGFNKFIADQTALPGEATVTLILFNHQYNVVYSNKNVNEVPEMTPSVYHPNGNTALYDALGRGVRDTGVALEALPERDRPGTVIVLLITDGEENSSVEFSGETGRVAVKDMVDHQIQKYNWVVVFMGANIDAKAVGGSLGIPSNMSVDFEASFDGTRALYNTISSGTMMYREAATKGTARPDFVENPDQVLGK